MPLRRLHVASRVGAWIETVGRCKNAFSLCVASRVGAWIETIITHGSRTRTVSHPVWVRGLKQPDLLTGDVRNRVASRVGAWIETEMRWQSARGLGVASRVGAWIETFVQRARAAARLASHPVWVRGLKPISILFSHNHHYVASRVGAWIETISL